MWSNAAGATFSSNSSYAQSPLAPPLLAKMPAVLTPLLTKEGLGVVELTVRKVSSKVIS